MGLACGQHYAGDSDLELPYILLYMEICTDFRLCLSMRAEMKLYAMTRHALQKKRRRQV
jgi:hypothetical protein